MRFSPYLKMVQTYAELNAEHYRAVRSSLSYRTEGLMEVYQDEMMMNVPTMPEMGQPEPEIICRVKHCPLLGQLQQLKAEVVHVHKIHHERQEAQGKYGYY